MVVSVHRIRVLACAVTPVKKIRTSTVHISAPVHLHIVIVGVFSNYGPHTFSWYARFERNTIISGVRFSGNPFYVYPREEPGCGV